MAQNVPVDYKKLLNEGLFYDITFIVGQEEQKKIKAHKCILSISSSVFESMFTGEFSEGRSLQDNDVRITDMEASPFQSFLEYIYTGNVLIHEQNWAPLLYAAEKYDIPQLKNLCQSFVDKKCDTKTACQFYNEALQNQVLSLVPLVQAEVVNNSKEVLKSDSLFKIQNSQILKNLLSLDELDCNEIVIYRAALNWATAQIKDTEEVSGLKMREVLGPALYSIRFSYLSPDEFMKEVVPKGILNEKELFAIFKQKIPGNESTSIPFPLQSRVKWVSRFNGTSTYDEEYYNKCSYDPYQPPNQYSIQFRVNKRVKILGIGIYKPMNSGDILKGKIYIKPSKNDSQILLEYPLDICYDQKNERSNISFKEPITIQENVWYTASMYEESYSVYRRTGMDGQTNKTVDGVQWTFDSLSNQPIDQGLLPCIKFLQLE